MHTVCRFAINVLARPHVDASGRWYETHARNVLALQDRRKCCSTGHRAVRVSSLQHGVLLHNVPALLTVVCRPAAAAEQHHNFKFRV